MNLKLITIEDIQDLVNEIQLLKTEVSKLEASKSKEWVSETEAMEILNVSKSTIQKFRRDGLIHWSQYKKLISYKYSDLMQFFEDHYTGNRNYVTSKKIAA